MENVPRRSIAVALLLLSVFAFGGHADAQPSTPMSGQILAAARAVTLAAATTRVVLQPSAAGGLRQQLKDLRPLFLVLDDLRAVQTPGIIYEIYLGLPPGAAPNADDSHYVGTLNFFAVAAPNTARRSRSYDVTTLVARLLSQGLPEDQLSVTIVGHVQSEPPVAVPPSIGSVALVAQ